MPTISRCPSSSVPTKGSNRESLQKSEAQSDFPASNPAEKENVRNRGYLFSMEVVQTAYRARDKPVWQVDVCAAMPDDRTPRGGAAR